MGALGQVESRLAAMGITVPDVVMPVGAYVPALREGDLVFTSGQLLSLIHISEPTRPY